MSERPDSERDLSGPLSIAVLLLLFLMIVGGFLWWRLPIPKNVAAFGDAFGGVAGTLVSGFALVLLVFTVLQQQRALGIQREDLRLTREELQATREELGRTADAQSAQVDAAKVAAKLNAATALFEHYEREMDRITPSATLLHELAFEHNRMLSDKFRKRIEAVLEADEVEASKD